MPQKKVPKIIVEEVFNPEPPTLQKTFSNTDTPNTIKNNTQFERYTNLFSQKKNFISKI